MKGEKAEVPSSREATARQAEVERPAGGCVMGMKTNDSMIKTMKKFTLEYWKDDDVTWED